MHVAGKGAGFVSEGSKNLASAAAEKIGSAADVVGEKTSNIAGAAYEGKFLLFLRASFVYLSFSKRFYRNVRQTDMCTFEILR